MKIKNKKTTTTTTIIIQIPIWIIKYNNIRAQRAESRARAEKRMEQWQIVTHDERFSVCIERKTHVFDDYYFFKQSEIYSASAINRRDAFGYI